MFELKLHVTVLLEKCTLDPQSPVVTELKIPRDLTEASFSGAGLSIIAALSMIFLFGMELSSYLAVSTTTSIVVDRSSDGDFLRIEFNISFPALSCEFASVDVSDVLGTLLFSLQNRLNITKTIRKFSIDSNLKPTGPEFHSGPVTESIKHDDESAGGHVEGSATLNAHNFDGFAHEHDILVVNFYAPWCSWSNRLGKAKYNKPKMVRLFPRPPAYSSFVHRAALLAWLTIENEG
ncbi:Protein disulfide-isomerase 5-4 [Ancistrocladus abbreviatus]